ncbi:MAG: hypothetical protein WBA39_33980 [Rivularia sp. (in: cyanobacteria)]
MHKVIEIPPIPINSDIIKPPWDDALDSVQQWHQNIACNEAQKQHLQINEIIYIIALHWLYRKKYQSKHKIPGKLKHRKACEPLGDFLHQLLNLCSEVHTISPFDYMNAGEWFKQIVFEMRYGDVQAILSDEQEGGKTKYIDVVRGEISQLRSYKNPYDSSTSPHTYRLLESAIRIAERSDIFRKKHYSPLIKAYAAWARELRENPTFEYWLVEGEKLVAKRGKGKAKIPIVKK